MSNPGTFKSSTREYLHSHKPLQNISEKFYAVAEFISIKLAKSSSIHKIIRIFRDKAAFISNFSYSFSMFSKTVKRPKMVPIF